MIIIVLDYLNIHSAVCVHNEKIAKSAFCLHFLEASFVTSQLQQDPELGSIVKDKVDYSSCFNLLLIHITVDYYCLVNRSVLQTVLFW